MRTPGECLRDLRQHHTQNEKPSVHGPRPHDRERIETHRRLLIFRVSHILPGRLPTITPRGSIGGLQSSATLMDAHGPERGDIG